MAAPFLGLRPFKASGEAEGWGKSRDQITNTIRDRISTQQKPVTTASPENP
jgi:hypothetical protein